MENERLRVYIFFIASILSCIFWVPYWSSFHHFSQTLFSFSKLYSYMRAFSLISFFSLICIFSLVLSHSYWLLSLTISIYLYLELSLGFFNHYCRYYVSDDDSAISPFCNWFFIVSGLLVDDFAFDWVNKSCR